MADKVMKIYLYNMLCIAVLSEISETEVNFLLNSVVNASIWRQISSHLYFYGRSSCLCVKVGVQGEELAS